MTDANFKSNLDLRNIDPEVRSYIYQMLVDFEPFTSPSTQLSVSAKDPLALMHDNDTELELDESITEEQLKKQWRISIALIDDGAKIEEEGLDEDIFAALKKAKVKLLEQLNEIQEKVLSPSDRANQIQSALEKTNIH